MPGRELSAWFYREIVRPLLVAHEPSLPLAAALIGPGSDVLGFDTARSMDHDWGPRVMLFVPDAEVERIELTVREQIDPRLPETFVGILINAHRGRQLGDTEAVPETGPSPISVTSVSRWGRGQIGVAPGELLPSDWLWIPQQRLLELVGGVVFEDQPGELTRLRQRLAWYPDDVWRYLLACQWQRVSQVEPFVGRTGEVNDDLGSRLLALSLVRDAMRLAFLLERQYAPYSKWFGTAFDRLELAASLRPSLDTVVAAHTWPEREQALGVAFELLAQRTNTLLARPLRTAPRRFHDRLFMVSAAAWFPRRLAKGITDEDVCRIIDRIGWVGSVDQWSDSVDLHGQMEAVRAAGRAMLDAGQR